MNILHGFTGSVASTLLNKFLYSYSHEDTVKFVLTASSKNFIKDPSNELYSGYKPQSHVDQFMYFSWFSDEHEWDIYEKNQKVLHIELTKWADKFIIAPCSANTLAKLANGICDNLLTCCARAWDFSKPFIVAPAMNTQMWKHRITQEHIDKLRSWSIIIREPISKTLYCGDTGIGAMANIDDIIK